MEQSLFHTPESFYKKQLRLLAGLLLAVFLGWQIAKQGIVTGFMLAGLPFAIGFVVLVFLRPRAGFLFFIVYSFSLFGLSRQFPGPQYGLGTDAMLVLTWLGVIFHRSKKFRFRHLNNDLVWLTLVWAAVTVFEIVNPERPSVAGWFFEMRGIMLYWVLATPLAFLLFNKKSDIDLFLKLIIYFSLAGAVYGMKQLFFGVNEMENQWLEAGAKKTHILFGKLRVFSYYVEAAQFGASQGHLCILCIILAVGPHGMRKKAWYLFAGLLLFYGMMISGTRGALAAIIGGGLTFLVLSKQVKILMMGIIVGALFFGMLKFTTIGNNNAEIVRLRTSLDPNDPSLQVRLMNQKILSDYLATRPFGGGVGVIGAWGLVYNKDKFLSTIPPDSLYVKIWAMYGIIGFIIWFGIMLYITGKCAGIIWETRDPVLKNKLSALLGGAVGILFCSYGNEVLNQMPSMMICTISWVLIWLSPRWDMPKVSKQHTDGSKQ